MNVTGTVKTAPRFTSFKINRRSVPESVKTSMVVGILFVCYVAGAKVSQKLSFLPEHFTTLWIPGGVMLAALITQPRRKWVYLFLTTLLCDITSSTLLHRHPALLSICLWFANSIQALIGASLTLALAKRRLKLLTAKEIGVLTLSGSFASAVGATLGALAMNLVYQDKTYFGDWISWWSANVQGIILITPAILSCLHFRAPQSPISIYKWLEGMALIVSLVIVSELIFGESYPALSRFPFLVLPLILWSAVRFNQRITSVVLFIVTFIITWNASNGYGPLIYAATTELRGFTVQSYLSIVNLSFLILSATMAERKRAEKSLSDYKANLEKVVRERTARLRNINDELKDQARERMAIEQELRSSEERYHQVAELSPVGIFRTDVAGSCFYVNSRWCKISGLPPSHAMSLGWVDAIHPDDRRSVLAEWKKAQITGELVSSEHRIRRPDGHTSWIYRQTSAEVNEQGVVVGYIGSITDISDRKHAEMALAESAQRYRDLYGKYRDLYNITPDMMLSIAVETYEIIECNDTVVRKLGFGVKEDLIGRSVLDFYEPACLDDAKKSFAELVKNGQILNKELQIRSNTGKTIDVLLNSTAVYDEMGQVVSSYSVWQDITDRKKIEQLRIEKNTAELSNKAKSSFLANASHEIRTPVTAINGFAQLLEAELKTDKGEHFLSVIRRNGQHLLSLIDDLLDLSKIESSQLEMHKGIISPLEEVDYVTSALRGSFEGEDFELIVDVKNSLPDHIFTDARRMRQILMNLISNSAKFTKEGYVKLTAKLIQPKTGSPILEFTVEDTGMGIDPETQKKLFHPFFRGHNIAVKGAPGSGLGLALSRDLARQLGGDVWLVESKVGQGSTFKFTLETGPLEKISSIECGEEKRTEEDELAWSSKVKDRLKGVRILVAEDSPELQMLVRIYLQTAGAEVEFADNGQIAVDKALAGKYDAVLMDIQMPKLTGYEATRELRKNGVKTPIIALTAHALMEEHEKCVSVGCDEYLSKPVNPTVLVETVRKHLG